MLRIKCPFCGERDETEFHYGGEAHIVRPHDPDALTDQEWGDYVFFRTNVKGAHKERWVHSDGCRKWFNAVRDTVTNEMIAVYKMGETFDIPDDHKPNQVPPCDKETPDKKISDKKGGA